MTTVDRVAIETDEHGFELVLEGDFTELCQTYLNDPKAAALRFNIHGVAGDLLTQTQDQIGEWHAEGESVRADHARYQQTGVLPEYVREIREADAERLAEAERDAADQSRKREKGE